MSTVQALPYTIAPLAAEAIASALPLIEAYLLASKLPVRFNPEKVERYWLSLYGLGCGQLFGLTIEGQLVGVLGVHVVESMFGDGQAVNEWVWWIDPAYRASGGGLALLETAEAWARAKGLGLIVGAYEALNGPLMARLYRRRGYVAQGGFYLKTWTEAQHG